MFEFFFKYPLDLFAKGHFLLAGSWPRWVLITLLAAAAVSLWVMHFGRRRTPSSSARTRRAGILWLLQTALLTLLLTLLWEPALAVARLKPQQNIVAVVVDDSASMSLSEGGKSRSERARSVLDGGLLRDLSKQFQVRLYRLDAGVARISKTSELVAGQPTTQIGKGLQELADEAGTLPIGAVVLLTDGQDNQGGISLETMNAVRRSRFPVHTVGFGSERLEHDVELAGLDIVTKPLQDSRLQAVVSLRQSGFSGGRAKLMLTSDGRTLASREVVLREGNEQQETVEFNAGKPGVKTIEARVEPLNGEKTTENNQRVVAITVDGRKRRLLYVEGEPRWEYKFLRRAVEDDSAIEVATILRTTQNKIYRQGIKDPNEFASGFPGVEDLFALDGLILGSVEAAYFSPVQQELIKDFVDRRGGGLLFLGGRAALADGGYASVPKFAELLPTILPRQVKTFERDLSEAVITEAGRGSLICRIEEDPTASSAHWKNLPYMADYENPGTLKPGAIELLDTNVAGRRMPLLVTENYGRGRTAVFATGGSWRWRMQQPKEDTTHQTFYRQLLRSMVNGTPTRVAASLVTGGSGPAAKGPYTLEDDGHVQFRAEVRDRTYLPTTDAEVTARVVGPSSTETVSLQPEQLSPGMYSSAWEARVPGSYVAEISAHRNGEELGADLVPFRRENGVAEKFHQEQNVDLLRSLASATGGRYYGEQDASNLSHEIAYSEAGVSTQEINDLWNMPIVFFVLLALRAAEWLLRRRWGYV